MLGNKRPKKVLRPAWYGISKCRLSNESPRKYNFSNKSLGFFLPQLTRKAFDNFGFSTASLILDWSQIVGHDIASWTVPEEIKWPKKQPTPSPKEGPRPSEALLILQVDPAHALEATYSIRQILDRINGYFGYRAISEVRLFPTPLTSLKNTREHPHLPATVREKPVQGGSMIQDPLKQALLHLEKHLEKSSWRQKT